MISFSAAQSALPGVSLLIALLAYGSQILFQYTEPSSLDQRQSIIFNTLVGCIWISYARACYTDPGRVPSDWSPSGLEDIPSGTDESSRRQRWCRRCESLKPPRAHHCKVCQRYYLLGFYVLRFIGLCLIEVLKMHTENGSPLPLDSQLCVTSHVSSLHAVSHLRCSFNGLLGVLVVFSGTSCVGRSQPAQCRCFHILLIKHS